ncbi:MAG: DUF58 domain-containing protein [Acidobacteriota bacterium]
MSAAAEATRADALRRDVVGRAGDRALGWYLFFFALLIVASFYSGGLFLFAAAVVATVYAAAAMVSTLGIGQLSVWRQLSENEVELGAVVTCRIMVQNRKSWPAPWLFFEDRVDDGVDVEGPRAACKTLPAEGKEHLSYRLHTYRRGLFRVGPTVAEASDPLGLVRRYYVDPKASFLTVLPRPVTLGQGWPLGHQPIHEVPRRRSLLEDPSRFRGVREYRRGDSLKQVHWRASARSRRLQVKIFEPSVLDGALLVPDMALREDAAVDEDAGGVDPVEELLITAATSVGHFVLTGSQAVGVLSNGADAAERYPVDFDGETFSHYADVVSRTRVDSHSARRRPVSLEPGKGERQWRRLRTLLARLTPTDGAGVAELLHVELPHLPRSLVVMVLTPRLDQALASALGALRSSGIESAVLWISAGSSEAPTARLPPSIPLYRIDRAADLKALGNQRL